MTWRSWVPDTEWTSCWSWSNGWPAGSCCSCDLCRTSVEAIDPKSDTSFSSRTTSTVSGRWKWNSRLGSLGWLDQVDGASEGSPSINVGDLFLLVFIFTNFRGCACSVYAFWGCPLAAAMRLISTWLENTIGGTRRSSSNIFMQIDGFRSRT